MDIVVKRTTELSDKEILDISNLFHRVFNRPKSSVFSFRELYENNPKGYSYHALWYDGDKIIGHNAYVPFIYFQDKDPFYIVLSIEAMTHPDYRGQGGYRKIVEACENAAREDGCKMRIGFPNENSYPIQKKFFNYYEIGTLSTYFLPVRFSCISKKLKFLNFLSILFSLFMYLFSCFSLKRTKTKKIKYQKDKDSFNKYRYRWFGGNYKIINKKQFSFCYKNSLYQGKKAIFLLDVYPLTKVNFDNAVRFIYRKEFSSLPAIIYVGNLHFQPMTMFKIPKCLEPKHFRFMAKPLDNNFFDDSYKKLNNWSINLSNFDLL